MDMSKYREMFLAETREHLDSMNRLLVALERRPEDGEGINTLFREAHSIKGMAASMGFQRMMEVAHHLEDFLDGFRTSGEVPASAVDHLLAGFDLLEGLLADIAADRPEREVDIFLAGEAPVVKEDPAQSDEPEIFAVEPAVFEVQAEIDDQAIASAARAMLILKALEQFGSLDEVRPPLAELKRGGKIKSLQLKISSTYPPEAIEAALSNMPDLKKIRCGLHLETGGEQQRRRDDGERTVRVRTELLDQFINLTGEMITNRYRLEEAFRKQSEEDLGDGLDQLARLVGDLHHQVLKVRMMPLESITGRLPRLARDLCRQTGKEVQLEISGGEIELDRAILEKLSDPLIHMLRNAIDHGIEQAGHVSLRAWREKDLVLVEVQDDGRGIDPEAIRKKAVEKGLLQARQADSLPDREILMLVCQAGFSTAREVSETSGRGVGMDVVKAAVESLGGLLQIESSPGKGTRILLKLPLTVAIVRILLVECAGHLLALPVTRVLQALELARGDLQSSGRQLVVKFADEALPLLSLRKILHLPAHTPGTSVPVAVVEARGRKVGLVVDKLVGQQEVFVRTLAPPLNSLPGVSGATVLGNGHVVFVLDPQGLLDAAATASPGARERKRA